MLEIVLCSIFTVLPDYLYRRYVQHKRIGHEITLYSIWFELRYGITACLMLTVALITIIFYYHPSTTTVTSFFRTIAILPETNGRVSEILIKNGDRRRGAPFLKLDSASSKPTSNARAASTRSKRRCSWQRPTSSRRKARSTKPKARSNRRRTNSNQAGTPAAQRQCRRRAGNRKTEDDGRRAKGAVAWADAARQAAERACRPLLPAEKASAEATLQQAKVDLEKTVVYAGVAGQVEQFALQVGDIVNPYMRRRACFIPQRVGRPGLQAGFAQIEAQVMKVGMTAEVTCASKPLTIIPMVVTDVQEYIASGQFRGGEQLIDVQQATKPGTITGFSGADVRRRSGRRDQRLKLSSPMPIPATTSGFRAARLGPVHMAVPAHGRRRRRWFMRCCCVSRHWSCRSRRLVFAGH